MRFQRVLLLLIIVPILLVQSCNDCKDIACFSPPEPFLLELVDKTSGENLFSNGSLLPDEVTISDMDNNTVVDYTFISENGLNLIQVNSFGWETETINYLFQASENTLFQLYVDAERVSENCCSFTRYNEITIELADFNLIGQSGVYSILID
jgi:hypothetical protein